MKIAIALMVILTAVTAAYFGSRINSLDRKIESMELILSGVPVEYLDEYDYEFSRQEIVYLGRPAELRIYRSPGHHYDFAAIINEERFVEAAFPIAADFPDADALRRLEGNE